MQQTGIGLKGKFIRWFKNDWNKLQLNAICLHIIAFCLSHLLFFNTQSASVKAVGQLIYVIDFFFWSMCLFQIILLHETMGVYVILIRKMVCHFTNAKFNTIVISYEDSHNGNFSQSVLQCNSK